ncbi:replication restart DNA helicase PriA [Balneicella halophila]|uniref:Replication restart protein PriA n=1 Tax=Balneicella halophila TaxID=1537566 RepID=A0A7L4URH7_BALHA|nr:primosomal protein N' [Balneicella halophila]PVX52112.1 replication restart DNA helicase PriA [Balneicella halophila]
MPYAIIVLPIAQQSCYTYEVPVSFQKEIQIGQQVVVPLGRKFYGGIVLKLSEDKPSYPTKSIISIWDKKPIVSSEQIAFWKWMASYYMCALGEVMTAALPAGFRIESEHKVHLTKTDYIPDSETERLIIDALQHGALDLKTLDESLGGKLEVLKALLEKEVVQIHTQHNQRFKPKEVVFLYPRENITTEEINKLSELQSHVLLRLIDLSKTEKVSKSKFLEEEGVTESPIKTLIKKEFIISQKEKVYRHSFKYPKETKPLYELSEIQQQKYGEIKKQFETHSTVLLHGITSSGKTEIYTHLIAKELEKGRFVLFLLPEIALTTQLAERLAIFFGKQLLVYHSKYSTNERVEVWRKLQAKDKPYVVIGARSAIFLPFHDLGLIVVDEEHEPSFKQQDPAPRYHGRDAAIYLAYLQNSKVLLGSATPSLESYFNVQLGKYGLVELFQRYQDILPPEIILIDSTEASRKKRMKGLFTPELIKAMNETLENGEQVILFQNRRGYSYFVKCENCDTIPHCPNCDVSLSLHKYANTLDCHYCNYSISYAKHKCGECQGEDFSTIGIGTEQIEEQTTALFPNYLSDRIDWDTTTGKHSYEKILSKFKNGETKILIGTQMLAKGLDFDNVGLVAILNADLLLHYPDFRAYERSFQLLLQVSGRAGRKKKQGKVLIQTYKPKHPVLKLVKESAYTPLYNQQIRERNAFHYPPVYYMMKIKLKHKNKQKVEEAAYLLGEDLKNIFGARTYGAHTPLVSRVKNFYLQEIILKIERKSSYAKAKQLTSEAISRVKQTKGFSSIHIGADVDVF